MDYKKDFPLLMGSDIAYMDSGATTQKPQQVIDALDDFYKRTNANPHRGLYDLSMNATMEYESARDKIAKFINASSEEILFTKNASEASNLVAYTYGLDTLQSGDEVVVSIMEHHSAIIPWQFVTKKTGSSLQYLYLNDDYGLDFSEIQSKITKNTKIVSITQISNALGTINDVKAIIEHAHAMGAVVIVDASQSIPHMPVDVKDLDADFLFFSGHKMLAPLGIGILYGKKTLLNAMPPFLYGGDMVEYVYEQETTFAPLPNKFEAGTQNAEGVIGLAAAIDYIQSIGYDQIEAIDKALVAYAREELSKLDYVTCYMPKDETKHASLISFNINGVHPHDVSDILNSSKVCVRAGNHCAQPLLRHIGLESTCRASFYLYNTKDDVDRLIQAIQKVYSIFGKYLKKG